MMNGQKKIKYSIKPHYHYAIVSEAINELRQLGYNLDFNLEENCITCNTEKFTADEEFEIKEIYRYEGDSDPGDEAAVYGIESSTGKKGILVSGYGNSSDFLTEKTLKKTKLNH